MTEVKTEAETGVSGRTAGLSVCLAAAFMTGLDVSIVNVALPSIQDSLHASEDGIQWILSGYALTFGLLLVPGGRLGDALGRRTVLLLGLALFTAASAVCGFAPNITVLIVARLVQGIAAGLMNPQVSGLIQQMFTGASRGKAFGALGSVFGLSTAAGPLIGGALVTAFGEEHGWRYVFLVNLPIGIVLLPLARRLLPAPAPLAPGERKSLDPVGVVLLGVAVAALLLPFIQYQQWHGGLKWLLIPAGLAVLYAFVRWERAQKAPLVDLDLLRIPSYRAGTVLGLVYFAGFTSIFFVYTVFLQDGHGYNALEAGAAITPFAVGSALAAAVGGRMVSRGAGRNMIILGLAIVVFGLAGTYLAVALVTGPAIGWAATLPLAIAGVGSGLVISPNQALSLAEIPVAEGGTAAGVLQTGQRFGTAVGIAAVGAVFYGAVPDGWAGALRKSLVVIIAFVLAALAVGWTDARRAARLTASR